MDSKTFPCAHKDCVVLKTEQAEIACCTKCNMWFCGEHMDIYRLCPDCMTPISVIERELDDNKRCDFISKSGERCKSMLSDQYLAGGAFCCDDWFCNQHDIDEFDDKDDGQDICPNCDKFLSYTQGEKLKCCYAKFGHLCDKWDRDYGWGISEGAICCGEYVCHRHIENCCYCRTCGRFLKR